MVTDTVPGMTSDSAGRVIKLPQDRLNSLSTLAPTLKHVHQTVRRSLTTGNASTEKTAAKRARKR